MKVWVKIVIYTLPTRLQEECLVQRTKNGYEIYFIEINCYRHGHLESDIRLEE